MFYEIQMLCFLISFQSILAAELFDYRYVHDHKHTGPHDEQVHLVGYRLMRKVADWYSGCKKRLARERTRRDQRM